jgi:hypothetical protein
MPVSQAPDQILQHAVLGQVPEIKPYEALTELNSRVKFKAASMAMRGQNAIAQAQHMKQQPPIAAQIMQANQQLNGIAALPVPTTDAYSAGGIVAFSGGGRTPYQDEEPTQEEKDREVIMRLLRDVGLGAGKLAAAGYDIFTLPVRGIAGAYNTIARIPRAFSVPLPFVPKEFGTESMTPMYDRYFRQQENSQPTQPPQQAPSPTQPQVVEVAEPSQQKRNPESSTPVTTRASSASAGTPPGVGSSRRPVRPAWPEYNPQAPKLTVPEAATAEELAAEAKRIMDPRMSEYDKQMQRFRERAEAMQRGEGIKTPSRFERGLAGVLAGATDEVAAARRAGVRPSLGMALAGGARAAISEDKEREKARKELIEKGQQLEMTLALQRAAYERGEYETANRLGERARQLAKEQVEVKNRQAELDEAAKERAAARQFKQVSTEREEVDKDLDRQQRAEIARAQLAVQQERMKEDDYRKRVAQLRVDPVYVDAMNEVKEAQKRLTGVDRNSPVFAEMQRQYLMALQKAQQRAIAYGVKPEDAGVVDSLTQSAISAPVPPDIQAILNKFAPR